MLENLQKPEPVNKTRIQQIMETLDGPDQEILSKLLRDPEWSSEQLSRALKAKGLKISSSSIQRFRNIHGVVR